MPLLSIKHLSIEFPSRYETDYAVEDVSFELEASEILGLVGESGAGKSIIGNGIVQLLSPPGRVSRGEIYLNDSKISDFDDQQILKVRGSRVGFIFQDPMTSLNLLCTVENQMVETILTNLDIDAVDERHARSGSTRYARPVLMNSRFASSSSRTRFPAACARGAYQRPRIRTASSKTGKTCIVSSCFR